MNSSGISPKALTALSLLGFSGSFVIGVTEVESARDPNAMILSLVFYAGAALIIAAPRWATQQMPLLSTMSAVLLFMLAAEQGYEATVPVPIAGQAPWFAMGFTVMIFALCLRQRFWWAVLLWVVITLMSLRRWIVVRDNLIPTESYTVMALGLFVATWVGYQEFLRFNQRKREIRRMLLTARSNDEAEQDSKNASYQRVQDVRRLAGGLLERIARDPSEVTEYDINQFRLTEAQLRDTIRGRSIATPYILEITRTARDRGVRVDILDERGQPLPPKVMEATTEQVAEVLNHAQCGVVTIRAFPKGDPTAVFIVHDNDDEDEDPIAIEIADVTGEVSRF
ncbi:hypothetical protein [Kocuria atrinae]|uniref:hypothetical protein n=1 Tax=Kocuria atrinae TaxID=592377 RepID=UPI0003099828|nr:hypothetical protein [Kocuria atrinae]